MVTYCRWIYQTDELSNFHSCHRWEAHRLIKPEHSGSLYFIYRHYTSIVLLPVCDASYSFRPCSKSQHWKKLISNKLGIPYPAELTSTDKPKFSHVFVADEAFGLISHIMRPYGGENLPVNKRVSNYRLSRARRSVERSFGILSNKWRIFHRPLNVSM